MIINLSFISDFCFAPVRTVRKNSALVRTSANTPPHGAEIFATVRTCAKMFAPVRTNAEFFARCAPVRKLPLIFELVRTGAKFFASVRTGAKKIALVRINVTEKFSHR